MATLSVPVSMGTDSGKIMLEEGKKVRDGAESPLKHFVGSPPELAERGRFVIRRIPRHGNSDICSVFVRVDVYQGAKQKRDVLLGEKESASSADLLNLR